MERPFQPENIVVPPPKPIDMQLQAAGVVADAFTRGDTAFLQEIAEGRLPADVNPDFRPHLGTMAIAANEALTKGDRNTYGDGTVTLNVDEDRLKAQQHAAAAGFSTGGAGMNVAEHGLGRSGADADDGEIDGLLARLRAGREPDAETVDDDAPVFVPSTLGTEPQALPSRPHATLTDENATRRLELPHRHAAPAHDEPTATGGHTLTFAGPGFGAAETHPYAPTATSDEPTRILRPAAQAPGQETTQIVRQPLHAEPAVYAAPSEHIGRHAAPDPEEATRALSRSAIAGALGHRDSDHLGSGEDARVILPGDSHPITIPAIYRDHGETTVRIPVAEQSAWPPLNNAQGEGGPGQKTVNLDAHRPVRLGETPHEGPTIPVTDALLAGLGAAGQRTGLVDEGKTVRFTLPDSAAQPMPREMPRNFPPRQ